MRYDEFQKLQAGDWIYQEMPEHNYKIVIARVIFIELVEDKVEYLREVNHSISSNHTTNTTLYKIEKHDIMWFGNNWLTIPEELLKPETAPKGQRSILDAQQNMLHYIHDIQTNIIIGEGELA